ncbi:MAG: FAD:protein FMN transferase [Kineosporiaceae bacterium]
MTTATAPRTEAGTTWRALGVSVGLVVTDPAALEPARRLLVRRLEELDLACSRFREDSEIMTVERAGGRPVAISPLLAEAVEVALDAARRTGGDLDPTMGRRLAQLGYDRTFTAVATRGDALPVQVRVTAPERATWRDVALDRATGTLSVPEGVILDLGATAKAWAADTAAAAMSAALGCGVLVSLGGDIAVCGPAPTGGWPIAVQDTETAHSPATVAITAGGLATSGTAARRWHRGSDLLHHVLDPRTGMPARTPWRAITVAAPSALEANVATTTAVVRGGAGLDWLRGLGLPARLVAETGEVTLLGGWPR